MKCIPKSLKIPKNVIVKLPRMRPPPKGATGIWDGKDEDLFVLTQKELDIAAKLADDLGSAWRAEIHYNLGWHITARRSEPGIACFRVNYRGGDYSACLSTDGFGSNNWAHADDPHDALAECVANQRARVKAEQDLLDRALDMLLSEA